MSVMRRLFALAWGVSLLSAQAVETTTMPVKGEWCSDFEAAKAAAEEEGVPLVVFCARQDCGNCTSLERAVVMDDFVAWRQNRQLYMYFHEHTYAEWSESYQSGSVKFCLTPNKLGKIPLLKVYWRRPDGTSLAYNFSGTMSGMDYPDQKTLQANLMRTIDKQLVEYYGYDPTVPQLEEVYSLSQGVAVALDLEQVAGYSAKGLPSGVKFDAKTGLVSGCPKKSGYFKVKFSKKNEDSVTTIFDVKAMSSDIVGTFNGFVGEKGERSGTLSVSVSAVGTITAKTVMPDGTKSFKATGFDHVQEDGSYVVQMATKKGETLAMALTPGEDWATFQLAGVYTDLEGDESDVEGQRNTLSGKSASSEAKGVMAEFADKYGFDAMLQGDGSWELVEPLNPKKPAVTVQLQKNGQVKVNGTLVGTMGTIKMTATATALPLREDLDADQLTLEATKPVKVNGQKRAASVLVTISDDGSAEGSARIVE